MSVLSQPHFHNEAAAVGRLEQIVWPNGPVCPHCGGIDRITPVKGGRIGLKRCGQCKGQFRATVGTVFEDSKVPLHKWFQAAHLLASSKKGISSHQLHRTLGVTYKTAWFMSHRLREAMRAGEPGDMTFMGGEGKVVEVDETYFGQNPEEDQPKMTTAGKPFKDNRYSKSKREKRTIVALVERGGEARSVHVPTADKETVTKIVLNNIYRETELNTDEFRHLHGRWSEVRRARNGQSLGQGIRARQRDDEHRRRLLLDLQARDAGRLPALQGKAPAPLSGGVRFSLQQPEQVRC